MWCQQDGAVDRFALYGDACGTLLVETITRLTLWEGHEAEQLCRLRGNASPLDGAQRTWPHPSAPHSRSE
ncbi:hypothetical protein GCM10010387_32750 [Streptomyces inusitatus]|uniref:Uncharacterized protein n=1 Tax=Streptomyces inusitatus TaxID=68221 RepID=A0A918Q8C6_9ACTN|nr:hypothetical protein GCM10010387_32750 [Streptomyces inusitatus]